MSSSPPPSNAATFVTPPVSSPSLLSASASTSHRSAGSSSSAVPACAACKHQRRKCTPECILGPYFPADEPAKFQNAHRLFGVKNILRILDCVGPPYRDTAMHTIIYESNVRALNPVHGCFGVIHDLHRQVELMSAELAAVQQQLAMWQAHQQTPNSGDIGNIQINGPDLFTPANFLSPVQQYAPSAPLPSLPPIQEQREDYDYISYDDNDHKKYYEEMVESVVPSLDLQVENQERKIAERKDVRPPFSATPCEGEGSKRAVNPPAGHLSCRLGLGFYNG